MKHLLILTLLFALNKTCTQRFVNGGEPSLITYSAMTRGSSFVCSIDQDQIHVKSEEVSLETKLERGQWGELIALLKPIPLGTLGNLMAPSHNADTDRARIAGLMVEVGGVTYTSAPFDEGNPPLELKPLIDKILALAETVE